MIKPTIGRVVWFTPAASISRTFRIDDKQPCAALITYVWSDRLVNLVVFDHAGSPHSCTSVTLLQAEDEVPVVLGGNYCEWMPYQIGQAKKHEPAAQSDMFDAHSRGAELVGNLPSMAPGTRTG